MAAAVGACGRGTEGRPPAAGPGAERAVRPADAAGGRDDAPPSKDRPAGATAADGRPSILFLGTSLTAGLGLDPDQAYPALIQRKLDSAGLRWRAINGGVSGETSAGALRRLDWILRPDVKVLVVETGANDGLRGLDVDSTRANIDAILRAARARVPGLRIVLAGMEAPPNLGTAYTSRFRAIYPDLARRERIPLIPFILAGVGGVDSLNQADGIHPNRRGERIVAGNVWRVLEGVVREAGR
jgi:acyl-CoA thioesterase-1